MCCLGGFRRNRACCVVDLGRGGLCEFCGFHDCGEYDLIFKSKTGITLTIIRLLGQRALGSLYG